MASTVDIHDIFDDSSAIATYQFEDDATDLGGSHDGTANSVTYEVGKFDKSAIFSSSVDSNILTDIVGVFNNTNAFSISFWMKTSGNVGSYTDAIFGNGDGTTNGYKIGCLISVETDGTISFSRRDGAAADTKIFTSALDDGNWYHVAAIFTGSHKYLYVDGVSVADGASTLSATNNAMRIGTYSSAAHTDEYYDGGLDQVRIFNKALSEYEVHVLLEENGVVNTRSIHDVFEDSSAVSTYQFEDDVTDLGGTNDGTPTSITYNATGKFDKSSVFNGSTSKIMIANPDNFKLSAQSVSLWFKAGSYTGSTRELWNNNTAAAGAGSTVNGGWQINLAGSSDDLSVTQFFKNNETTTDYLNNERTSYSAQAKTPITLDDTWKHIVAIKSDKKNIEVYIDTVFVNSVTSVQDMAWSSDTARDNVSIGVLAEGGSDYYLFDGEIDQVRIFNKALSQSEIDILGVEQMQYLGELVEVNQDTELTVSTSAQTEQDTEITISAPEQIEQDTELVVSSGTQNNFDTKVDVSVFTQNDFDTKLISGGFLSFDTKIVIFEQRDFDTKLDNGDVVPTSAQSDYLDNIAGISSYKTDISADSETSGLMIASTSIRANMKAVTSTAAKVIASTVIKATS